MHLRSESIGAIAGALAKAQTEISNPEKSLTGTIHVAAAERSFRYASLSSGLELVRKSLGRHEIATVQTTSFDDGIGIIRLKTMLVHASGEWIASDWPVCAIAESAVPHRLGTALTYARRYALFTLVGIAGEDDLDAPDMNAVKGPSSSEEAGGNHQSPSGYSTSATAFPLSPVAPKDRGKLARRQPVLLADEDSKALRDRLIYELEQLKSPDDLTDWAHRILPLKNQMTITDACAVEAAFALKIDSGSSATDSHTIPSNVAPSSDARARAGATHSSGAPARQKRPRRARCATALEAPAQNQRTEDNTDNASVRSVLILSKPLRRRDREHLKFVGTQACLVCGRQPSDAHHLKFTQQPAMGRKVSDEYAVPLCRHHHRELHHRGDERIWWRQLNIDPLPVAERLWQQTRIGTQERGTQARSDAGE